MASSLFGPQSQIPSRTPVPFTPRQNEDPVDIATQALNQSNGNAKEAFYTLAQQKGVDPNQFLKQIESMGDIKKLAQNMLMSNPRVGNLFKLFGAIR